MAPLSIYEGHVVLEMSNYKKQKMSILDHNCPTANSGRLRRCGFSHSLFENKQTILA